MPDYRIKCSLHSDVSSPDKRNVRDRLQSLTQAQTEILLEKQGEDISPLETQLLLGAYAVHRFVRRERYAQVQSSLKAFTKLDGSATAYVTTATSPSRYQKPLLAQPFIPIGEYGYLAASRLMRGVLGVLAAHELRHEEITSLAVSEPERTAVVRHHTFQGNFTRDARQGFGMLTQIGLVSVGQALALLTIDKVEETSWDTLAQEVIESELLTEFVRRIGPNLLPQMVVYGHYKHQPVIRKKNNELALSMDLKQILAINRSQFKSEPIENADLASFLAQKVETASQTGLPVSNLQELLELNHLRLSSGTTCPAANRGGEITQIARRILEMATMDQADGSIL